MSNLMTWVVAFVVVASLEAGVYVIEFGRRWGVSETIDNVLSTVALHAALGLVLGVMHDALTRGMRRLPRRVARARELLLPTWPVAVTAAVAPMILLATHDITFARTFSRVLIWTPAVAALLAIYVALHMWARRQAIGTGPRFRLAVAGCAAGAMVLLACAVAVQIARASVHASPPTSDTRHIVLISIDTLRSDYVGSYGSLTAKTPAIDALARDGARFTNAFSPIPVTGPAHATMLTGKSPVDHGVRVNGVRLPAQATTVTEQLRGEGFRTAAFVSGYPLKAINSGLDQGFQLYEDRMGWLDRFDGTSLHRLMGLLRPTGYERSARRTTDHALQWLSRNADEPFFLFVHYFDPHYPYGSPAGGSEEWAGPEDVERQKQLYADEVTAVDAQIGRIVKTLKQRGIYEQSLIIVTADHGEAFGEHGTYYDHVRGTHDALIRIPLVLRAPSLKRRAAVFDGQVGLHDIPKTILAATRVGGGEAVGREEGDTHDLVRLANDRPAPFDRFVAAHNFQPEVEYDRHAVRSDRWKLIRVDEPSGPRYELYDLVDDPDERVNLIAKVTQSTELRGVVERHAQMMPGAYVTGGVDIPSDRRDRLRSLGYLGGR